MESYLIKQVEPLRPRRRVYHRMSRPRLWSVDEKAGTLVTLSSANNNNSSVATVVTATQQQGSGGGPTSLGFIDEETTTDWQPEIPFENVRGQLNLLHVTCFGTPAYFASNARKCGVLHHECRLVAYVFCSSLGTGCNGKALH